MDANNVSKLISNSNCTNRFHKAAIKHLHSALVDDLFKGSVIGRTFLFQSIPAIKIHYYLKFTHRIFELYN